MEIPAKAEKILNTLQSAGYEAYVVGGCVRDSLLNRTPGDWDITTSATPWQVKALFRKTVDTGLKHGTVTVLDGGEQFEVTTYRVDGTYEDGRHPSSVTFTGSLKEDLQRRDFTINAMAYNKKDGLVDIFGGVRDLDRRLIRAVGDPEKRFEEDALRMMRAVRFAAQLDYKIDEDTAAAIGKLAPNLQKVSSERIRTELEKLLVSDHPEKLRTAYETGLTRYFLPEFDVCMATPQNNPHHCYSVGEHILHSVTAAAAGEKAAAKALPAGVNVTAGWDGRQKRILRLTMLLHDIAKPACRQTDENGIDHFHGHVEQSALLADTILRRLKYDNDTRRSVVQLIKYHDWRFDSDPKSVRRAAAVVTRELFPLLMEVKRADIEAQSDYTREEKTAQLEGWIRVWNESVRAGDCLTVKELKVTGEDLIAAGIKPGRQIGKTLHLMLEDVLETPSHNDRQYLLSRYT